MLVEYKTSSTRADTGTQHSVGIMYFHPLIKWSDSTFGFEYFLNDRLVYIFHKSSQSHKAFVTRFVEVCFHSNQRWRKMYNQRIDRTKKEKKNIKECHENKNQRLLQENTRTTATDFRTRQKPDLLSTRQRDTGEPTFNLKKKEKKWWDVYCGVHPLTNFLFLEREGGRPAS